MMDVRNFIGELLDSATDLSDKVYIDLDTDEESFDTPEFEISCSGGYLQITVTGVDNHVLITKDDYESLTNRIEELEAELEELK